MSRNITIKEVEGKPGKVYYPLQLNHTSKPTPGPGQVLVKIHAAALNHRDFFQRQRLYPGISFDNPILADGYGTVESLGPNCSPSTASLKNKPVLVNPCWGWASAEDGPEGDGRQFGALGGTVQYPVGMASDYAVCPEAELVPCPSHLGPAEGAALPLVGLTAWRALMTKTGGNAQPGRNILITGIGGGVALAALQFAVSVGANVYVTSGSAEKLEKAKKLGAKGGVSYKDPKWEKSLASQLPKSRPFLDAIVDGAGGDIVAKSLKLLKSGGVISIYGMTVSPKMDWTMGAVLRNIEVRGSTMGSRREFADMVKFVSDKKIVPVVSRVAPRALDDLSAVDALFEEMRNGSQFGKLVLHISDPPAAAKL